eukprot:3137383-Amphidinium_carterae.1
MEKHDRVSALVSWIESFMTPQAMNKFKLEGSRDDFDKLKNIIDDSVTPWTIREFYQFGVDDKILLCAGDEVHTREGEGHLDTTVEWYLASDNVKWIKRPVAENFAKWLSKDTFKLGITVACVACAQLRRSKKWPEKTECVRSAYIAAVARSILDEETWSAWDLCEAALYLLIVVAKACDDCQPRCQFEPIKRALLDRAIGNKQVATKLFFNLGTGIFSNSRISLVAKEWLQDFQYDLYDTLPKEVRRALRRGKDFFNGWHNGGFEGLKFEGSFLLPVGQELEVEGISPVNAKQEDCGKSAPTKFYLNVNDGSVSRQKGVLMKNVVPPKDDIEGVFREQLLASLIQL